MASGFAVEHLGPMDELETRLNGTIVTRIRVPRRTDAIFLSQIRLREKA